MHLKCLFFNQSKFLFIVIRTQRKYQDSFGQIDKQVNKLIYIVVKLAIWGGDTPEIIHAVDNKAKMNCKSFIEESILHAYNAREITPKTDQV